MRTSADESDGRSCDAEHDVRQADNPFRSTEASTKEDFFCGLPAEIIFNVWRILTESRDGDMHYDSRVVEQHKEKARRNEFMRYLPMNIERFPNLTLTPPYTTIPLHHDTALRSCSKHLQSVCDNARTCIFLRAEHHIAATPYLKKLRNLKAVSIEYEGADNPNYSPISLHSSLASLQHTHPALTSLILRAATYYPSRVDISSIPPSWGSTLQHLELHSMKFVSDGSCEARSLSFLSKLTALQVLKLDRVSPFIKTKDIASCSGLQKLTLTGGHLHFDVMMKARTLLDLSSLTSMQELVCESYSLVKLKVSGLKALWHLDCHHNRLETLDVSSCNVLQQLLCGDNSLKALDLTRNPKISTLDCSGNPLAKLKISGCAELADLKCGDHSCSITELDLSPFARLHTLECAGMHVRTLDLHATPTIKILRVYGCEKLLSLDLSGLRRLKEVSVKKCRTSYSKPTALTSLDVTACTALRVVDCADSFALTTLRASGCSALQKLDLSGCPMRSLDLTGCLLLAGPSFLNRFPEADSLDLSLCGGLWDVTRRCTHKKALTHAPSAATLVTLRCKGCAREMLDACGDVCGVYCWGSPELNELLCLGCGTLRKLSS